MTTTLSFGRADGDRATDRAPLRWAAAAVAIAMMAATIGLLVVLPARTGVESALARQRLEDVDPIAVAQRAQQRVEEPAGNRNRPVLDRAPGD
jgi:hypothetical protein